MALNGAIKINSKVIECTPPETVLVPQVFFFLNESSLTAAPRLLVNN